MTESDYHALLAAKRGKKPQAARLTKKGKVISPAEELLAWQMVGAGLSFHRWFNFHPRRKWESDFCLPEENPWLIVEVEGWGSHQKFLGFEADAEKYAEAMMLGFVVLRVTPRQIAQEKAIGWIKKLIIARESNDQTFL